MLWLYYVGWISTTPHYCQMIRDVNKEKRLTWCRRYSKRKDDFRNVIWSDECTVQIDTKRKCSKRIGQPKPLRPKPKHPAKVHIWGAISMRGASPIVIFTQNLNATRYAKILDQALLPFIHTNFNAGIGINKITIPSIHLALFRTILKEIKLNGGAPLLSHLTLTP